MTSNRKNSRIHVSFFYYIILLLLSWRHEEPAESVLETKVKRMNYGNKWLNEVCL